jgi:hypothetical protein
MSPHATQGATEEGKTPNHWTMGRKTFERRMPHHDGIEALWETRWKLPVSISTRNRSEQLIGIHIPITPGGKPSTRD